MIHLIYTNYILTPFHIFPHNYIKPFDYNYQCYFRQISTQTSQCVEWIKNMSRRRGKGLIVSAINLLYFILHYTHVLL